MKKAFLILAVLLTLGSSVRAGGGLDYCLGAKLGYQTSTLSLKTSDITSSFWDHMAFGLFGRINLGSFYVQPEVLYFKSGNIFSLDFANLSNTIIPTEGEASLTLNESELQVPILVGWQPSFLDFGLVSIRAQVGPTINYTLASTTVFDKTYSLITTDPNGQETEVEITPEEGNAMDPHDWAWGLQAGIGVDIIKKITIDINYNFGLSNVFSNTLNNTALNNYFDFSNVDNTKKNMFMVTVGYKIL